jgi:hypothetical protein
MSPTKYEIAKAEIDRRMNATRHAGNLAELERCAADLTALYRAYCGEPKRE